MKRIVDKGKKLKPHRANAGIESKYFKALNKLIRDMHRDFKSGLKSHYQIMHAEVVNDNGFTDWLKRFAGKWLGIWKEKSPEIVSLFLDATESYSTNNLKQRLKKAGYTVDFKPNDKLKKIMKLSADENVNLIRNIPQQYIDRLSQAVYQSALAGRDYQSLTSELSKTWGITRRRAKNICHDQSNKLTGIINRTRSQEAGITEGIWLHSGAPKHPRLDHVKASKDKLNFSLKKGAKISGEYIFPGELINCNCTYLPVIPDISDNSEVVNDVNNEAYKDELRDPKTGRWMSGGSKEQFDNLVNPENKEEVAGIPAPRKGGFNKFIRIMDDSRNPKYSALRFIVGIIRAMKRAGGEIIEKIKPSNNDPLRRVLKDKNGKKCNIVVRSGKESSSKTPDSMFSVDINDYNIRPKITNKEKNIKFKFPLKDDNLDNNKGG